MLRYHINRHCRSSKKFAADELWRFYEAMIASSENRLEETGMGASAAQRA